MRERGIFNRSSVEQELKIPHTYPLEEAPVGGGSVQREKIVYPPQNAIKKTPKMLEIEREFADKGRSIEDIMRASLTENGSVSSSSASLGISFKTFRDWASKMNMPHPRKHDRENPIVVARRAASLREAWRERGTEIAAKIHTPASDLLRSRSQGRFYATHPEERSRLAGWGRKGAEATRKAREEVLKSKLGDDPVAALRQLHIVQRLSLREISSMTGIKEAALRRLGRGQIEFRRETYSRLLRVRTGNRELVEQARGIDLLDSLSQRTRQVIEGIYPLQGEPFKLKELAGQLGGISVQRVRQIEQAALAKLRAGLDVFPEYDLNPSARPDYWREFDVLSLDPRLADKLLRLGFNSIKDLYYLLKAGKVRGLTESELNQLEDKIESFKQELIVSQSIE